MNVTDAETRRFRDALGRCLGLQFEDPKLPLLAELLAARLAATKLPTVLYLERLEQNVDDELGRIASELTVPETYFFRNIEQFRAYAEVVLPERMAARAHARTLSMLSAGCATGDEAYTLAMVARDCIAPSWNVTIRAADVNPAVIAKAERGRYSSWALRETDAEMRRRWFTESGREFVIDESLRASVTFLERNLASDGCDLWQPESYDVVFCRNMMMYFTPERTRALVERITRSLLPGGYLFLGHAETLRGLSDAYHLHHTHGTFYYQRKDRVAIVSVAAALREATQGSPAIEEPAWSTTWIEAVQRATERIESLSAVDRQASPRKSAPARRPQPELDAVFELLGMERFAEALELLGEVPAALAREPDVLLVRAVLLTQTGQLDAAEDACGSLLEINELSAGAHYLLALCREDAGDRQAAIDRHQVAAYLDPGFAMPRLHLGLIARRSGDLEAARRELGQALVLLQREEPARLLLFGGGFGRDALVAVCRRELLSAGGQP